MPNMSLFELLFALLLVCVLAAVSAVAVLAWSLVRRADGQAAVVAELRQRLDTGGLTQESQAAEIRERVNRAGVHPGSPRTRSPDLPGIGVFSVAGWGHLDAARPFLASPDPMPGVPDVGGNLT